jgi:hypothetical protein
MRDIDELFKALAGSGFRRSFRLRGADAAYLHDKGLSLVMDHAKDFIAKRLAPAYIANDGKQTPFRGHPVFVAQHATATCCRGCLAKWHHIPTGRQLDQQECDHILLVLKKWLTEHADIEQEKSGKQPDLFS